MYKCDNGQYYVTCMCLGLQIFSVFFLFMGDNKSAIPVKKKKSCSVKKKNHIDFHTCFN